MATAEEKKRAIKLEKWMDDYFFEQELLRIEQTTNPGIRKAFQNLGYDEELHDTEPEDGIEDVELAEALGQRESVRAQD